ncbi:MAG: hypothetical protein M1825_001984 [Sarcosagium campestre]|nr:MAG: hypothetical protein M1825_001984 [Sarcosagium campestre]
MATIYLPGNALPESAVPGPGTHHFDHKLTASLAGPSVEVPAATNSTSPTLNSKPSITIPLPPSNHQQQPTVDAIVLCRVTRIQSRQANVSILVVGDAVCRGEWAGVVRYVELWGKENVEMTWAKEFTLISMAYSVQDIRATEKDKVKVGESFRPGDIVRAQVISLGDQSNYYLSTASNHLGVVMAASEAGNAMYPVSWKQFKDPITGDLERRKVAKPF